MLKIAYCHQVVDKIDHWKVGPFAENQIEVDDLERILKRYEPARLEAVTEQIMDPENTYLILTFDDGYKDNFTKLLPLLEKYNFPTIIFVTTSFIEENLPFEYQLAYIINRSDKITLPNSEKKIIKNNEEKEKLYFSLSQSLKKRSHQNRKKYLKKLCKENDFQQNQFQNLMLDWSEIKELDNHDLITIGSHGHEHIFYRLAYPWRNYKDMKKSKKILEDKLNRKINHFAYPYGAHSYLTELSASYLGFQSCFTTNSGIITKKDEFYSTSIPRIPLKHLI